VSGLKENKKMSEKTEKRQTAAEIKREIQEASKSDKTEKAKTAIKESGMPLNGMLANEINATPSTPDTTSKAESKPDPEKAAEKKTDKAVDLQEWAKKKGIDWTTEETVLSALHKSDQAFHAKRQVEKAKEQERGYAPPAPSYQPPPTYAPSPQPNQKVIENIARSYNMLPEDVVRLMEFNRDFFETAMRAERERQKQEWEQKWGPIELETKKNSVFRELSSDPVFRNSDVQVEYHKVLDELQNADPQSFERDPSMYKRAFDMALSNIARRNLEGRKLQEGVPPNALPVNPPPPLGEGSGGGSEENESGIDPTQFAKLSLEEKRRMLEKSGLRLS
jgi:hypothetical protein